MMKISNINAIILAAGLGLRLRPYTETLPKCLTSVAGVPILENTINNLKKCGITNITIVIGYQQDKVKSFIRKKFPADKIQCVINKDFMDTGTAYSLNLGIESLNTKGSSLIIEGDVFFEFLLFHAFLTNCNKDISTIAMFQLEYSGSFVKIDKNSKITEWLHESMRSNNDDLKKLYKTVNIHFFAEQNLFTKLLPVLKEYIAKRGVKTPLEYVLAKYIKSYEVKGHLTDPYLWYEVDTIEDLKIANEIFSGSLTQNTLAG